MNYSITTYCLNSYSSIKIALLTDVHNNFDDKCVNIVEKIRPDLILIAGDIIIYNKYLEDATSVFLSRLAEIAPSYLTLGNHECAYKNVNCFINDIERLKIVLLKDSSEQLTINGRKINLIGLNDILYYGIRENKKIGPISSYTKHHVKKIGEYQTKVIDSLIDKCSYNIVLSHRPDLFKKYISNTRVDLVVSGHTHGGQICLKNGKAIYATGQGPLPEYASGLHYYNSVGIIISRGVGNSILRKRLNCPCEIIQINI